MAVHVEAMLAFHAAGIPTFDYGNNIRQVAKDEGVANAFDFPGFVPAYVLKVKTLAPSPGAAHVPAVQTTVCPPTKPQGIPPAAKATAVHCLTPPMQVRPAVKSQPTPISPAGSQGAPAFGALRRGVHVP